VRRVPCQKLFNHFIVQLSVIYASAMGTSQDKTRVGFQARNQRELPSCGLLKRIFHGQGIAIGDLEINSIKSVKRATDQL
jgi:hypothetical protein